jgi:membrane protease YdiL (CAAX protease family)
MPRRDATWPTIVVYLILRILLVNGVRLLGIDEPGSWLSRFIEVALYLVIALMIWAGRRDLGESNIDRAGVITFLLFGTVLRTFTVAKVTPGVVLEYGVLACASVLLAIFLTRSQAVPPGKAARTVRNILIGLLAGGIMSVVAAAPSFVTGDLRPLPPRPLVTSLATFALFFAHAMGHSAILEEPVFRGFLLGAFRGFRWTEARALAAQAILFWIGHLYLAQDHYLFLVVVPLAGLLFGLLTRRNRSIMPALVAHATFNALNVFWR